MEGMERSFIRVPCECLSARFQQMRKKVTKELGQIVASVTEEGGAGGVQGDIDLQSLQAKLAELRAAVVQNDAEEKAILERCLKKVQLLGEQARSSPTTGRGLTDVGKRQLERMIGEYLLRMGYLDAATMLEQEAGMQGMLELDVLATIQQVEKTLVEQDCGPALAWCAEHSSKLRRINSPLEFQLHKQQFLELVRQNERMAAIQYATDHLSSYTTAPENAAEIQVAMATLAFSDPASCPVPQYASLFAAERWRALAVLFAEESKRCYGLGSRSALEVCLHAGLTALKTPVCMEAWEAGNDPDDGGLHLSKQLRKTSCPVCTAPGRILAAKMPFAHFSNSHLVCRRTGETMNSNNPPVALPNGQVYSQRAVKELMTRNGVVTCPHTGETFRASDLQNIYII